MPGATLISQRFLLSPRRPRPKSHIASQGMVFGGFPSYFYESDEACMLDALICSLTRQSRRRQTRFRLRRPRMARRASDLNCFPIVWGAVLCSLFWGVVTVCLASHIYFSFRFIFEACTALSLVSLFFYFRRLLLALFVTFVSFLANRHLVRQVLLLCLLSFLFHLKNQPFCCCFRALQLFIVELGLELLCVGHLADRLHKVLLDDVVALGPNGKHA